MGPSPDSWWVDVAHQLEKQSETHSERKMEGVMRGVSVITEESESC